MTTRKAFYYAVGDTYARLAQMSAESLVRHNPDIRVTIFTDQELSSPVFAKVIRVATPLGHHEMKRAKLATLATVRAKRGLLLDCDTYITGDLAPVFDLLGDYDIAAAYDSRWLNMSGSPLGAYVNAGVIAFTSNKRVRRLWREWAAGFDADPKTSLYGGLTRDQPALERAIAASGVRLFVLSPEYNLRATEFVVPISGPVRIIHAITPMLRGTIESLAAFLNATTEGRCYFPLTEEMAVREVRPAGDGVTIAVAIRTERFTPVAVIQSRATVSA